MNFGQLGSNNGTTFSMKSSGPPQQRDAGGFSGPDWNHQQSFYPSSSPSSNPTSYMAHPAQAKQRNTEPIFSPGNNFSRPVSQSGASSEVSLGDLIDVFVDDKFLKSHNVHYGPAVIHVNGGGDGPIGSPRVTGSGNHRQSSNGTGGECYLTGLYRFRNDIVDWATS